MKNTLISSNLRSFTTILIFFLCSFAKAQSPYDQLPFSTNQSHLTMWNGEDYVPIFIKGINLGIAKPSTFPGELAASRGDYARWFKMIQEAGFNAIRLYTLHFPHFYTVLDSFNTANPNRPLYFFQGIWIEEEIPDYDEDLYTLRPHFENEMAENVRAVHGDVTIDARLGKAYGTYTADVSKYMLGYLVGREIHPPEVWHTNEVHSGDTEFSGNYLSIANTNPSEVWMTSLLDDVLTLEKAEYDMMHPVSFSSWPSLDPMHHPEEPNKYEDSVTIDLSQIDVSNAPGGYFASYHAYPYYPDFVSKQTSYQDAADYLGQNSYLGYIRDLKAHYTKVPLLIAEFGTSSSWGIAHYGQSDMHHGGLKEIDQGDSYLRMFRNFEEVDLAGGVQFAWMDEWFKRTWITDPYDYNPDKRVIWQNITAAEQNFGLIGFRKPSNILEPWESLCSPCEMESIEAGADYSFFRFKINLSEPYNPVDTLWVGIDTYSDSLGESILPNGHTSNHRAEFAIMLTQDNAEMYVTASYDTYGIWHGTSAPTQLYRSNTTDGAPWNLVRWKNNNTIDEIQFIGRLGVNRLNLPLKSTDAVIISGNAIEFRLPWTLLHFVDPSSKQVMHDDRSTQAKEEYTSEGVALDLYYRDQHYATAQRYAWENWPYPAEIEEYKKRSYDVVKQGLENIGSNPVAHADSYALSNDNWAVSPEQGVIANDISFSAHTPEAYVYDSPKNGLLQLNTDGSFTYQPVEYYGGDDSFTYRLRTGPHISFPVTVKLKINNPLRNSATTATTIKLYPNPSKDVLFVKSDNTIEKVELFNQLGQVVYSQSMNSNTGQLDITHLSVGHYFARLSTPERSFVYRIVKN